MIDIDKCKATLEKDVKTIMENLPKKMMLKSENEIRTDLTVIVNNTIELCKFINDVLYPDNCLKDFEEANVILNNIIENGISLIDRKSIMDFDKLVQLALDVRHLDKFIETDMDVQQLVIDNNIRYTGLCFTRAIRSK